MVWTDLHKFCIRFADLEEFDMRNLTFYLQEHDVNCISDHRTTPLHFAALGTSSSLLQVLLDYRADVNFQNIYGATPLHYACLTGRRSNVRMLLHSHAISTIPDVHNETALHWAVEGENIGIIQILLEHNPQLFRITNNDNNTALDISRITENEAIIKYLEEYENILNNNEAE